MNKHDKTPAVIIRQTDLSIGLQPGEYSFSQLLELGIVGGEVSSIQVARGYQAIVYAGERFDGDSKVISSGGGDSEPPRLKRASRSQPFGSIRVIAPLILVPEVRDREAVRQAVEGWWPKSMSGKESRISWWREAKFGCFIHWGVYSLSGGRWKGKPSRGYAEHLMRAQTISLEEYKQAFIDKFNPEHFDAESWVQLMKAAGMKYVVITAKHHDGFALYPSEAYPFDIRLTPFGRDPLMELKDACRRHGLAFGLYYSHAFDWEHPDAPGNDWEYTNPGGDLKLYEGSGKLWFSEHPELLPRVANYYVDQKAIPQIIELIRNYEPDLMWFDTPHKLPLSENLRILQAIRQTDNRVVVNGRLIQGARDNSFADYVNTADRALEIYPCAGDWETIPTTNESYGYSADDHSHKPAGAFIQLLAKSAARGGNVLMNLGPMGDGRIDQRDIPILREIGHWLDNNGESIYGTSRTPLPVQDWGESTRKGNLLFLHVFEWPKDGRLVLAGLKNHIRQAWLLADKNRRSLETRRLNGCDWLISVPDRAPDRNSSVVAVEVDGEPEVQPARLISRTQATILKAFDADISQGIGYGDGKLGNDYIRDWNSIDQLVRWKVRLDYSGTFQLVMTYSSPGPICRGRYVLALGGQRLEGCIEPTSAAGPQLAEHKHEQMISLLPGEHELMIRPVRIDGDELMRLYSVTLVPLDFCEDAGGRAMEVDATDVGD